MSELFFLISGLIYHSLKNIWIPVFTGMTRPVGCRFEFIRTDTKLFIFQNFKENIVALVCESASLLQGEKPTRVAGRMRGI